MHDVQEELKRRRWLAVVAYTSKILLSIGNCWQVSSACNYCAMQLAFANNKNTFKIKIVTLLK